MATPNERRLARFAQLVATGSADAPNGPVQVGVDLGTGNIVVAVADSDGAPIAGASMHSTVVRDGVVVDWVGAVSAVENLLAACQRATGLSLTNAAAAIPPGIDPATVTVFSNVLEACGLNVVDVVDEPVAAARGLGISTGAVIDVGHGTTGISVIDGPQLIRSVDEATGGHHMTLVLAGAMGLSYEQAEARKTDPECSATVLAIVRPTVEKMATIAAQALEGLPPLPVFLVGGATALPGAAEVFAQVLGVPVTHTSYPLYPTPLGTAVAPVVAGATQLRKGTR